MVRTEYNKEATEKLIEHDRLIENDGYYASSVIQCLKKGADPNVVCFPNDPQRPFTSMEWAMIKGEVDVMKFMFEKGAVVTTNTYRAFLLGYEEGFLDEKEAIQETRIPYKKTIIIGKMLLEHELHPDSIYEQLEKKTFRQLLEQDCRNASVYLDSHLEAANINIGLASLRNDVQAYHSALDMSDSRWKDLYPIELESQISALEQELNRKKTMLEQLRTPKTQYEGALQVPANISYEI